MMKHVSFQLAGVGCALAIATSFVATGLATAQQTTTPTPCSFVRFSIANPTPGGQVLPGPYQFTGSAFDSRASSGSGIASVSLFLGNRDSGGTNLGNASFASSTSNIFTLRASLPSNNKGPTAVYGYATSAVDGSLSTTFVQFTITDNPTPGAGGAPAQAQPALCGAGQAPAATPSAPPSAPAPAPAPAAPSGAGLQIKVANPQPGATILHGPYSVSGTAFDPAASSGSGVDRVTVFLDNRDTGGQDLGDAQLGSPGPNGFTITVGLPSNNTGPHSLFVYAHDSVTGKTGVVIVPVTIS
jgi:hypothetical protein